MGTIVSIGFYPKDEKRIDKQYVRELIDTLFQHNIEFFVDVDPNTKKCIKSRECKVCFRHDTWNYQENTNFEKAIEIVSQYGGGFAMASDYLQFDLGIFKEGLVSIDVMYSISECEISAFISVAKILYNFIHPFYGEGDIEETYTENYNPYKDVKLGKIKHIYWINFFSPELVKKIGRETLLSAPSWKTEELKDDGILLMLGPTPYDLKVEREEVEKYLGFKE